MEFRSFQVPRWLTPVLGLLALALIPIAMMVAVCVAALALGTTLIRAFVPSIPSQNPNPRPAFRSKDSSVLSKQSAIDVEYEVKDQNEKK
jgi:hypothetical protein